MDGVLVNMLASKETFKSSNYVVGESTSMLFNWANVLIISKMHYSFAAFISHVDGKSGSWRHMNEEST